jgi:hypothetical protein
MKYFAILLVASLSLVFSSCIKDDYMKHYDKCELCSDGQFEDFYDVPQGATQKILIPIEVDPSCNCIVSGKVEYIVNNKTFAVVDYGDGECDEWAEKYMGEGKCGKKACCKFKQDCTKVK